MADEIQVRRRGGRRHHSRGRARLQPTILAVAALGLLLAGCGNVPIAADAEPARLAPSLVAAWPLGIERSYRAAYRLLDECFAAAPYRVRGTLAADRSVGEIQVDRGVGLEQTLFLRTGLYLTLALAPDGSARTRLSFRTAGPDMDAYARGLLARIDDPTASCRG